MSYDPVTHPEAPYAYDTWDNPEAGETRKGRNEAKAAEASLPACWVCGRGVKPDAAGLIRYIHLHVDGSLIPAEASAQLTDTPHSQGVWPIGPECAKHYPAAYILRDHWYMPPRPLGS
jgi:hypothetical protein